MPTTNSWSAILVVVGALLLLAGIGGAYVSSLSFPGYFVIWLILAFAGVIVAMAGIAMGMGSGKKE
jgi:peptidoglycan/LPS O-acetylase OafA/YrhL